MFNKIKVLKAKNDSLLLKESITIRLKTNEILVMKEKNKKVLNSIAVAALSSHELVLKNLMRCQVVKVFLTCL